MSSSNSRFEFNSLGAAAWFITFRTFGTWLPGDERGSIDRGCNVFGTPRRPPDRAKWAESRAMISQEIVTLDADSRAIVDAAVRRFCDDCGWYLHALAVRTNHVHPLVTSTRTAGQIVSALKRAGTMALKAEGRFRRKDRIWARQGSTRPLWTEREIVRVAYYIDHMQDDAEALPWAD